MVTMRAQSSLRCVRRAPEGRAGVPVVQTPGLPTVKPHQVEVGLQGQAQSRSSSGGSLENKVTIRPLRLQEDYSPGERILGGFRLPLPQMRIKEHLRVLEGALGAPSPPEPWQAHSVLAPIPHYPPPPPQANWEFRGYPSNRPNSRLLAFISALLLKELLRSGYLFEDRPP